MKVTDGGNKMGIFDLFKKKKTSSVQPADFVDSDSFDMSTESLSLSLSKDTVDEELSKPGGYVSGNGNTTSSSRFLSGNDSITNEQITKGTCIGDKYEVISNAIRGGMGSVWKVHHKGWNTDLAMKRPKPKFFEEGSEKRKEKFINECKAWINLGLHPNIVSCYYVREIGGVPSIFSEWMENGSLGNRIGDKTLYEGTDEEVQKRLLDIAIQFARGLHYAHESEGHLIHQDVKPDNLLLSKEWDAKVADFGLARARLQMRDSGSLQIHSEGIAGNDPALSSGMTHLAPTGGYSPAYSSPEQRGGELLTRRTDIFSWAVSVLEMYIGECRWDSGEEAAIQYENLVSSKCRVSIPKKLKGLLRQCLNRNPEKRPHDFAIIEENLKTIYMETTQSPYLRRAPETAADTAGALNNRALSFLDIGDIEDAERCWVQALERNARHEDTVFNHALFLWRQGKMGLREAKDLLITVKDKEEREEMIAVLKREEDGRILLPEYTAEQKDFLLDPNEWCNDGEWGESGEFVRKVSISPDRKYTVLDVLKREGPFGRRDRVARILERHTRRVVREIDFIVPSVTVTSSYPPKKFAMFSPDSLVLAMSCCTNTQWRDGLPQYIAETEFWDIRSGSRISRAEGCMLLGFMRDGSAVLYDQDKNIRFGCRPEKPVSSDSPLLFERRIKQDYEFPFFYPLSDQIGLIEIGAEGFHNGVLVCDLSTGEVLKEIMDNPERRGEYEERYNKTSLMESFENRFALTEDGRRFLWMYISPPINGVLVEPKYMEIEVWDMKTWQYLGCCHPFRDTLTDAEKQSITVNMEDLRGKVLYMIAHPDGLRYEPGELADYRVSVVERTDVRLDAQTQFDSLLAAARESVRKGNEKEAIRQVDEALEIPGFGSASRALRVRAEITDRFPNFKPVRIVPSEEIIPPPEITEPSTDEQPEPLPDIVLSAIEKLKSDVKAGWERNNSVYDEWEVYTVPGERSLDGSKVLVHLMTVDRYDSPAQDDLEVSHIHGAAVLNAVTGEIIYIENIFCSIEASALDYQKPSIRTEEYETVMTPDGKYLLTRTPSHLLLTNIDDKTHKTLKDGVFSNAYLIKNNRFVLCKTIRGYKVLIIDVADCSEVFADFPSTEYGSLRYIDQNSFTIGHSGEDILCWIVWDQTGE